MTERTAEDRAAGILRVVVGSVEKTLPTLKAKYVPEWGEKLHASRDGAKPLTEWTLFESGMMGVETVRQMVGLIAAYDRTASLGGREWLEENADPTELHETLIEMVDNAFPLADAPTMVALALVALSAPQSSTSGASTSGAATPNRSSRRSTRSK